MTKKSEQFNPREWFSAVFLAHSILQLPPREDFDISADDLKNAAMEYLAGLIARHGGGQPVLSDKTREITALIFTESTCEIARNGGGLQ